MNTDQYLKELAAKVKTRHLHFSAQEYTTRKSKLLPIMQKKGIDVLLITEPADINYLTGYSTFEVSLFTCLLLNSDGDMILLVPSIETGPAFYTSKVNDIVPYHWSNPQSITALINASINKLGGQQPTVGVDLQGASLPIQVYRYLQHTDGYGQILDGAGLLNSIKIIKSEAELDYLRHSAAITSLAVAETRPYIAAGKTDDEIAGKAAQVMFASGSGFMNIQPVVTTGYRSSIIHTSNAGHKTQPGDVVFMEFGATWHRYTAPLMNTVIAGKPDLEMKQAFATCQDIYATLMDSIAPGVPFSIAARKAQTALEPIAGKVFFSGVYGYTVGAKFPPSWIEGSGFISAQEEGHFQQNMVFHLPLCLRAPGKWGIGFSETIVVGANGAYPITNNIWALEN